MIFLETTKSCRKDKRHKANSAMYKQKFIKILRDTRTLKTGEKIILLYNILRNLSSNKNFRRENPCFALPAYDLMQDAYGSVDYKGYYSSGMRAAKEIYKILLSCLPCLSTSLRILEWGCGPARIIRHLRHIDDSRQLELYGTDYNGKAIRWCQQKIENVLFRFNSLAPPLPFEDNFFDILYSISVYTHLSEKMHYPWLKENLRVVKPGGIIMMTLHGDNFADKLLEEEKILYNSKKIVVRGKVKEGSRLYVAFHSPLFVKQHFFRGHKIVYHNPNPDPSISGGQDIWVISK